MSVPATTGTLKTKVSTMKIGDYIKIGLNISDWTLGYGTTESPLTGVANGNWVSGMFYYLIKVDKGILVSDRVIIHSWSWDAINSGKYFQGRSTSLHYEDESPPLDVLYRSLTGGVAHLDTDKKSMSLTNKSLGGWPSINEYDKYIMNFPIDNIQNGKTLEDVFHHTTINTFCKEIPVNGVVRPYDSLVGSNIQRIARSYQFHFLQSSYSSTSAGFRPVFEYKEV